MVLLNHVPRLTNPASVPVASVLRFGDFPSLVVQTLIIGYVDGRRGLVILTVGADLIIAKSLKD